MSRPMMHIPNVARFEKVSKEQFAEALGDGYRKEELEFYLNELTLPTLATLGSAGHDFYAPFGFHIDPGQSMIIPTGVRAVISCGWVLTIYPRSSLGFKYGAQLANTVGIIDSDYSAGKNEGHIFIKVVNRGDEAFFVNQGDRFAQGIFLPYGVAENAEVLSETRTGGMGSTGK